MASKARKVQQSKRMYASGVPRRTKVPASVCSKHGKQRYRSRKDALEVLLNIRMSVSFSESSSRKEKRAYKCEECSGWHLTSQVYVSPSGRVKV